MIRVDQKMGLQGEFQVVVRRADGSIRFETQMQPNLMLDNAIKFYLGLETIDTSGQTAYTADGNLLYYCLVGSGNQTPAPGDIKLQNQLAVNVSSREHFVGREEPTSDNHEGYVKLWQRKKFIFDSLNNKNITEVGLACTYSTRYESGRSNSYYHMVTRALIKDSEGTPITITVLEGEILEVVYQVNLYVDIKRQSGSFTLTTTRSGQQSTDEFEYFLQPYSLTDGNYSANSLVGRSYNNSVTSWGVKESDEELSDAYDLADEGYMSINHKNTDAWSSKVDESRTSYITSSPSKYSEYYLSKRLVSADFETKKTTLELTSGIYTHIHTNGIRGFSFGFGQTYTVLQGLVVLKNKANGQGIKKTNKQLWKFTISITVDRWEE